MPHLKLGLRIESLRMPMRKAIPRAALLGVDGIQVDAVREVAPTNLSATGRRDFLRLVHNHGLELASLGFPTRHGFTTLEGLEGRIAALKEVLSLGYDLGSPIVTAPVGRVPEDLAHPIRITLSEALREIGAHGDRSGSVFAVETGTESGKNLRGLLDSLGSPGVRANYDPGNLLIKGYDPIQAALDLHDAIVHAHAHDAVRSRADEMAQSVAPGSGDLEWEAVLGALEEVGYHGWLTIEINNAVDPETEIARAVSFLRRFLH